MDEDGAPEFANLERSLFSLLQTLKPPREEGKMWVCVFYYAPWEFWRRFQRAGAPRRRRRWGLGVEGVLFRNHGNQTGSLHKLCSSPPSFFDLVKAGVCLRVACISISKMLKDSPSHVAWLFVSPPSFGSVFLPRASISRDPFYDMLATRKRRIANKKWREGDDDRLTRGTSSVLLPRRPVRNTSAATAVKPQFLPQRLSYKWLVGQRSSGEETQIDKLCFLFFFFFWFLHRATNQPAGLFLLSLPHGRNSSPLSTSTPRLRRTRMHVGSRRADVFCVCACCRCARHVQCGCMCVKGQADNKTIPGCAAGAKTPHLDCAVKTDALPGAASENQRFDISRALKEHCSLESAGLIKKKKIECRAENFKNMQTCFSSPVVWNWICFLIVIWKFHLYSATVLM